MKVRIKRLDTSVDLPTYQTDGSVAFDLAPKEEATVEPGKIALIPTGLVIETPPGYMLLLAPRSSTAKKFGISKPHSIGIIDQDYAGDDDEILIQVYNFRDKPVTLAKGERIAQGVFVQIDKAEWDEVTGSMGDSRGGVGSTG